MTEHNYPRQYWWIVLIAVPLVGAAIGIIPPLFENYHDRNSKPQTVIFRGNIIDKNTELPIKGAKTFLDFQGNTHTITSDSEGGYGFQLIVKDEQLVGRIRVESSGYEAYDRFVELSRSNMIIETIQLISVQQQSKPRPKSNTMTITPTEKPRQPQPSSPSQQVSDKTAVFIVDESNDVNWTLSHTIGSLLQKKGVRLTSVSFPTDSFVAGGEFENIFRGGENSLSNLKLSQHFKYLIAGKRRVTFQVNTELENVITASMTVELHVVSSQTGTVKASFLFRQNGPGFSDDDASETAESRIIEDIERQIDSIISNLT